MINNFLYASHTSINGDQGDIKIDWNTFQKNRVFGRSSRSQIDNPTTNNMPLFYNSFGTYPTHNGVLDWVRTISQTIVNEARLGVNYVLVNNGAAGNGIEGVPQSVGLPGIPSSILPAMNFSGGNAATIGNSDVYQLFADTVIQYEDTMNITKGVHTMHLGFQGWRQRINTFYSGNNGRAGTFSFDGRYTAGPNPLATSGGGSGLAEADFVLGLAKEIGGGTINLGLRWELHTPG